MDDSPYPDPSILQAYVSIFSFKINSIKINRKKAYDTHSRAKSFALIGVSFFIITF